MRLAPIICAALTMTTSALSADPVAPASPQIVLPKGTIVRLRLDTDLRAGQSKVGQAVLFTVDRDVYGPGHNLLLTSGMQATGQVTASTEHDLFGRRGRLTFVCNSVRAGNGVQVPVNLVVGSGSGAAADAADQMDAQEYYSFRLDPLDPEGYVQSASSDGYYTQLSGLSVTTIYDPGRLFGGGPEVTAKHGEKYTAHVAADTSLPIAQRY